MHVTEVRIWSEARPHTVASLVAPEDVDDQLAFAARAVDALFALGDGLFDPLAVNEVSRCVESESDELLIPEGHGVIRYPVERSGSSCWVAGPLATRSGTAPFEVRIVNECGELSADWTRSWSPWIDEDGAGRPDVEAAIRRLSAMGWEVEAAEPA